MEGDQFPVSWGSITGKECHDAGGREGIGNLFIQLETALLPQTVLWRGHTQPMDFVVICVPTEATGKIERFLTNSFGAQPMGRN